MSERELRLKLEDKLSEICKILSKGNDVELRKDINSIKIFSVDKKLVAK